MLGLFRHGPLNRRRLFLLVEQQQQQRERKKEKNEFSVFAIVMIIDEPQICAIQQQQHFLTFFH